MSSASNIPCLLLPEKLGVDERSRNPQDKFVLLIILLYTPILYSDVKSGLVQLTYLLVLSETVLGAMDRPFKH